MTQKPWDPITLLLCECFICKETHFDVQMTLAISGEPWDKRNLRRIECPSTGHCMVLHLFGNPEHGCVSGLILATYDPKQISSVYWEQAIEQVVFDADAKTITILRADDSINV